MKEGFNVATVVGQTRIRTNFENDDKPNNIKWVIVNANS